MKGLANATYTDSVSAQVLLAAPTAGNPSQQIKRIRISVKGATCRVQVKHGTSEVLVDQDFPDGGGMSEPYETSPIAQTADITVTTTGTGTTTRCTLLGGG